jgi:hypothetical protein
MGQTWKDHVRNCAPCHLPNVDGQIDPSLVYLLVYDVWVVVATLALGLQPRQRLARVQAKREARESHFMPLGVQKSVKE